MTIGIIELDVVLFAKRFAGPLQQLDGAVAVQVGFAGLHANLQTIAADRAKLLRARPEA